MFIYDRFREACAEKGTTITQALRAIGRAEGCTGTWKAGKSPRLDVTVELADHLGMTLDELVFGKASHNIELTIEEQEWLDILHKIPADRQQMCKDFLKTHMVVPEKYSGEKKA